MFPSGVVRSTAGIRLPVTARLWLPWHEASDSVRHPDPPPFLTAQPCSSPFPKPPEITCNFRRQRYGSVLPTHDAQCGRFPRYPGFLFPYSPRKGCLSSHTFFKPYHHQMIIQQVWAKGTDQRSSLVQFVVRNYVKRTIAYKGCQA